MTKVAINCRDGARPSAQCKQLPPLNKVSGGCGLRYYKCVLNSVLVLDSMSNANCFIKLTFENMGDSSVNIQVRVLFCS